MYLSKREKKKKKANPRTQSPTPIHPTDDVDFSTLQAMLKMIHDGSLAGKSAVRRRMTKKFSFVEGDKTRISFTVSPCFELGGKV